MLIGLALMGIYLKAESYMLAHILEAFVETSFSYLSRKLLSYSYRVHGFIRDCSLLDTRDPLQ